MNIRALLVFFVFIGLTAFNLSETYIDNSPSIKIVSGENYDENNFVFSIKLCSDENLINFSVTPEIIGENDDAAFNYDFADNTKSAVINYFYVVPLKFKALDKIKIDFILTDNKSVTKISKTLILKKDK